MKLTFLAAALASFLACGAAQAVVVTGTFSGTLDSGMDTTGVFGTAGTDLTGVSVTGTVQYDTDQLTQMTAGTITTGEATFAPNALQFSLTIFGMSYNFYSATTASVSVDTGASQVTMDAENMEATPSRPTVVESVTLDAYDPLTPFTSPNGLQQMFAANPLFSSGTFLISDIDASNSLIAAQGTFTLGSYALGEATDIPEPASVILLGGAAALAVLRRRSARV